MKQLMTRAAFGALTVGIAGGLAFLAFILATSPQGTAQAEPAVTVGIDGNPYASPANTATSLGSIEACIEVASGAQFDFDIYITEVTDLLAWDITLNYDKSVLKVIDYTLLETFLAAGAGSNVLDMSDPVPNSTGNYRAGAADLGSNHDSGSGVLVRLTLEAVAAGYSPANPTSVSLWDSDGNNIGDSDGDGYFDGPIVNGLIAVDGQCPDADGDTIYDGADNCPLVPNPDQADSDGDGIGDVCDNCPDDANPGQEDGDSDDVGDVCDNCPDDANSDQTNTDASDQDGDTLLNEDPFDGLDNDSDTLVDEDPPGDTMGDACDADDDADGFRDSTETYYGSDPLDLNSLVEVCDGLDNDLDTFIDEGYDYDGNTVPDCTDPGADTDNDGSPNPDDLNDDDDGDPDPGFNDGFLDTREHWMGSDSLDACPDNTNDHAWPPDTNNDTWCNVLDVLLFPPYLLTKLGDANYNRRFDLNADKKVNVLDVLKMPPYLMTQCTD